ncbi:MAG TPA: DUF3224 domain-containing protein [Gemmatimonadaceae bacterium]|nr:DUF3224 domain-containing protein [Gemmatimonadaceae bacterium]
MAQLEGAFDVVSWDEEPYDRIEGQPRFSHVRSVYEMKGSIQGEASLCYLLAYADDIAHFVGFALVTGTVNGKSGSFVMNDVGTYDNDVAKGRWMIIPGLGRGALSNIRGYGHFATGPSGSSYLLEVSF